MEYWEKWLYDVFICLLLEIYNLYLIITTIDSSLGLSISM